MTALPAMPKKPRNPQYGISSMKWPGVFVASINHAKKRKFPVVKAAVTLVRHGFKFE
eukprot:CAMPEP_0185269674 /NCGR_PEP_ID=MMETSP1359-20130426/40484_1 /TAXON_ID=552665 /ORGANISM="Bigelowiella longifila, Strain CCMP242" /LENGTH=56 /DNA_ID=CAMNT_0027860945 /DNA_START=432 /DNA_END=602 /DNA_ORIENTATION=-